MVPITRPQLTKLAPRAKAGYLDAFGEADTVLARYQINTNPLRVAHFMAQVLHETGGLVVERENMNYRAERMTEVWGERFPTVASARPYEHNETALANKVYNGRMGNRSGTNDGFDFRGRGLMQITGREDYHKYGALIHVDLEANPDLAIDPRYTLLLAAAEWVAKGCSLLADQDDIKRITYRINGGYTGLDERKAWLVKTKKVWA